MFGLGPFEMVIILVIVLVIFGAGKLPKVMGDLGKGVKSFKQGMNDKEASAQESTPTEGGETTQQSAQTEAQGTGKSG